MVRDDGVNLVLKNFTFQFQNIDEKYRMSVYTKLVSTLGRDSYLAQMLFELISELARYRLNIGQRAQSSKFFSEIKDFCCPFFLNFEIREQIIALDKLIAMPRQLTKITL